MPSQKGTFRLIAMQETRANQSIVVTMPVTINPMRLVSESTIGRDSVVLQLFFLLKTLCPFRLVHNGFLGLFPLSLFLSSCFTFVRIWVLLVIRSATFKYMFA